jgi:DNA-binding MarR family transcriptional regulator/N-acetylglutamate synthase-like GNAT family acetyltransferase
MDEVSFSRRIDTVRQFNRFYTRRIGLLHEGLLSSPYSLTEVRILYELAHRKKPIANDLCRELGLDPGYLSRILRRFEKRGIVEKASSQVDGRQSLLSLTQRGKVVFAPLDKRSHREVAGMLRNLSPVEQERVVHSMRTVQAILSDPEQSKQNGNKTCTLRPHQSGDMGWVVYRHGVLYAQEYGYDDRFEALVAGIVAEFVQGLKPKRERCWIAERDGEIVGSVFLVTESERVAKLRLLLVEPSARGLGIGQRLIDECARFARQAGYEKITLWTQSELLAARHLYQKTGFHLTRKKRHHSFGKRLVAETWELKL